jgi:hypothetical protein
MPASAVLDTHELADHPTFAPRNIRQSNNRWTAEAVVSAVRRLAAHIFVSGEGCGPGVFDIDAKVWL